MSDYGRIVTTNQGKNMVTESIRTKSAIIFTKISLGDGLLNGETIETMTGLKHRLLDGNIPKINPLGNGEIEAVSTVSNSELTTGFFARELGLFAKLGEEGEEQLFAYTNAGSNASYIPPNTSVDEKMLGIQLGIGDATVQINYQSHLYITYEQLEDGIAHHNNDANAHGGLLQNLKNQLSTHNTDISSHPAITDAIAKILGATDWQENPVATLKDIKTKLGEGGIVAQRFGESGFVKYANGFTIQWGQFKENQTAVSYLISYIEIFGTVTMMKDEPKRLYEASIRANNITTTGFELHSGYVGNHIAKAINNGFWINVGRS
nr:MAG TPA: tail-collar fiber protein [Bacteriophage sp.]